MSLPYSKRYSIDSFIGRCGLRRAFREYTWDYAPGGIVEVLHYLLLFLLHSPSPPPVVRLHCWLTATCQRWNSHRRRVESRLEVMVRLPHSCYAINKYVWQDSNEWHIWTTTAAILINSITAWPLRSIYLYC